MNTYQGLPHESTVRPMIDGVLQELMSKGIVPQWLAADIDHYMKQGQGLGAFCQSIAGYQSINQSYCQSMLSNYMSNVARQLIQQRQGYGTLPQPQGYGAPQQPQQPAPGYYQQPQQPMGHQPYANMHQMPAYGQQVSGGTGPYSCDVRSGPDPQQQPQQTAPAVEETPVQQTQAPAVIDTSSVPEYAHPVLNGQSNDGTLTRTEWSYNVAVSEATGDDIAEIGIDTDLPIGGIDDLLDLVKLVRNSDKDLDKMLFAATVSYNQAIVIRGAVDPVRVSIETIAESLNGLDALSTALATIDRELDNLDAGVMVSQNLTFAILAALNKMIAARAMHPIELSHVGYPAIRSRSDIVRYTSHGDDETIKLFHENTQNPNYRSHVDQVIKQAVLGFFTDSTVLSPQTESDWPTYARVLRFELDRNGKPYIDQLDGATGDKLEQLKETIGATHTVITFPAKALITNLPVSSRSSLNNSLPTALGEECDLDHYINDACDGFEAVDVTVTNRVRGVIQQFRAVRTADSIPVIT